MVIFFNPMVPLCHQNCIFVNLYAPVSFNVILGGPPSAPPSRGEACDLFHSTFFKLSRKYKLIFCTYCTYNRKKPKNKIIDS